MFTIFINGSQLFCSFIYGLKKIRMVSTVGILVLILTIPVLAIQEQEVDANDSTGIVRS